MASASGSAGIDGWKIDRSFPLKGVVLTGIAKRFAEMATLPAERGIEPMENCTPQAKIQRGIATLSTALPKGATYAN